MWGHIVENLGQYTTVLLFLKALYETYNGLVKHKRQHEKTSTVQKIFEYIYARIRGGSDGVDVVRKQPSKRRNNKKPQAGLQNGSYGSEDLAKDSGKVDKWEKGRGTKSEGA